MGPAPPAATRVKRRGEWPRSIDMYSTAWRRFCSSTAMMPAAASSTDEAQRLGHPGPDGLPGGAEVEVEIAPPA